MPKQTAVEWLWLNLTDDMIGELSPEQIKSIYDVVQQALAMEKEQKDESFKEGFKNGVLTEKWEQTYGGSNE
jgi:hypothetical protein